MFVAAFFCLDGIPEDLLHIAHHRIAREIGELHPVRRQHGDVSIDEEIHHACVVQDAGHIRGDKCFSFAHADDRRRPIARRNNRVGGIGGNHADGVSPRQPPRRPPHRLVQQHGLARVFRRAKFLLDQVSDHFRICLGDKYVTFFHQLALQIQVIFDDAVMHHHDPAGAVSMGMSILFGWPPMGGPARVPDAVRALQRMLPDHFFQVAQLSRRAAQFKPVPGGSYGDTGRVISAVFQPPQAFQDDRDDIFRADISYDSAHSPLL